MPLPSFVNIFPFFPVHVDIIGHVSCICQVFYVNKNKYSFGLLTFLVSVFYTHAMSQLRAIRQAKCLSQEELAVKSGLHYTTINRIENGHHKRVHYRVIRALAKALNCRTRDLELR